MLKPTENEKDLKKKVFDPENQNRMKIIRYSKLCDKMKDLFDYNNSNSIKKKHEKLSSPLQTYY